jgi:hypothetical protein
MPDIICTLPKHLIIGESGLRRQAKYTAREYTSVAKEVVVNWEDHPLGLIARNVPVEIVKMLTALDGYKVVATQDGQADKSSAPPPATPYPAQDAATEIPSPQAGGKKPSRPAKN